MDDSEAPIDFLTALARLLSSQTLRDEFAESPEFVAKHLRVDTNSIPAFLAIDHAQLEEQAETLLVKRWHEVCELAPESTAALGDQGLETFRYFATNEWPTTHRRHPIDAYRFLLFLKSNRLAKPNRGELHRLRRMSS